MAEGLGKGRRWAHDALGNHWSFLLSGWEAPPTSCPFLTVSLVT